MLEQTIQIIIYIHAFFGGLGLISGLFSIIARKGGKYHRKAGRVFTYSMLVNSSLSCFVSAMPRHESTFLFLIGVFTIYMVLSGNRALTFKNKQKVHFIDLFISWSMLLASVSMIIIGFLPSNVHSGISVLFPVFGSIGFLMTLGDLKMHKRLVHQKHLWLTNHLSKMMGAFIASITAFLVVALDGSSLIFWLSPTVLGTVYIFLWTRKVSRKSNGVF